MKKIILVTLLSLAACNDPAELAINTIAKEKYYTADNIPDRYQDFYGKWKLVSVSGGFSGKGFDPDFNFLEIKEFGIYGIIKDNVLIENGKIEVDTFDRKSKDLQVKFVPDSLQNSSLLGGFSQKYVELEPKNRLNLISMCCDAYNHHFERVK